MKFCRTPFFYRTPLLAASVTIHAKSTILDVWQSFKYVFQSHCCYTFFVKFGGNFKCCSSFPVIDSKHIYFICLRIKLASIKHDKWRWKEARWSPNFFVFCLLVSLFVLQMLSYWSFTRKHLSLFLIKLQVLKPPCNFIKNDTPTQVFSSEICEIFKNTFFHIKPPVAASEFLSIQVPSVQFTFKPTVTKFPKTKFHE